MRSRYKIVDKNYPYFITSSIIEWIPIFTSQAYFEILLNTFKFSQESKNFKIHAYVILDNHFHMIVSGEDMAKAVASIKSYSAKLIIEQLKLDGKDWALNQFQFYKKQYKVNKLHQVWQEGFHPKQLLTRTLYIKR